LPPKNSTIGVILIFLMKKTLLPFLLFALSFSIVSAQTASKSYELRNGNFYNGINFTPATWYVAKGVFTKKAPAKIDSVIDLSGKFVIPPIGDAHCSSVADNPSVANIVKAYAEEGAFYLQILSNTQEGRAEAEKLLNKSDSPEAIFGNGSLTCTLGYPFVKYEAPAQGIRNPSLIAERYEFLKQQRKMLGNGYWFIDSKEALDANWEKIKAQKPGVLLIYLLDSQNKGGKESGGLTPEVAKAIVKKAHKSGFNPKAIFDKSLKTSLRVYAYVETADDVRLGLQIGVDGFANLPGHNWDGTGDLKKYELSDADLQLLAKKKTAVVTLFSHGQTISARPAVQEFHAKTLKRLFDSNVNLVLGSDDPQRTTRSELNYWYTLGNLDDAAALKVLCENTPRAIFPYRKIGKIADGYEASFLVLNDNPLQNILKIRAMAFKMKNGQLVK
jgi:imidazolonepropionase-like amidohydrolase